MDLASYYLRSLRGHFHTRIMDILQKVYTVYLSALYRIAEMSIKPRSFEIPTKSIQREEKISFYRSVLFLSCLIHQLFSILQSDTSILTFCDGGYESKLILHAILS